MRVLHGNQTPVLQGGGLAEPGGGWPAAWCVQCLAAVPYLRALIACISFWVQILQIRLPQLPPPSPLAASWVNPARWLCCLSVKMAA